MAIANYVSCISEEGFAAIATCLEFVRKVSLQLLFLEDVKKVSLL